MGLMQIYIKKYLILQGTVYNYDKIMYFHNCVGFEVFTVVVYEEYHLLGYDAV
jgi:hypothetical protein